jgi:hypothetical protein
MQDMTTAAIQTTAFTGGAKLRLLPRKGNQPRSWHGAQDAARRPTLHLFSEPKPKRRPVLVAGGDSSARAAVLRDLTHSMPASTTFEQAGAVWEVLVRASRSSMVILSGGLDEVSAESLMQMLAHRHPSLPVVSLPASVPAEPALASA